MSDTQDGSDSDALSNVIVRALGRELKRLRAIHRDAEARIHHLETKVDDVENKYGDLVALSSDHLETSHQAALTRTAGLEARNTELEGENMRLQRELDDSRRALLERWIKEEDAEPCILAAGSPYQQVKRALDDSIQQREEERLEHSRVVKILQDDLSEMEGKRDHLTKALALANRDLDAIRSRYPRKVVPVNTSDSESSSDDERAAEVVKDSVSNIRVFAATALADDSDDDESTSDGLPSDKSSEKDEGDGEDENEDEEDEDEEDEEEGEGGDEDEEDDEEDDAEYEGNGINVQESGSFDPSQILESDVLDNTGQFIEKWRLIVRSNPSGQALQYLRKVLPYPSLLDHAWRCTHDEIIWSPAETQCLLVFPFQHYDVASQGITDMPIDSRIYNHETHEFFHRMQSQWFYRGTFKCVGWCTTSFQNVKDFARGRANVMNTIIQRTTGTSDRDPNLSVRSVYLNERLDVVCCGLVRLGTNTDIERTIGACNRDFESNVRKRPSHNTDNRSRKKRKVS